MKIFITISIIILSTLSAIAQQDTGKKEYLVKYEVLTKKGIKVNIGFFDKDNKNAGMIASEQWTYSFTTKDKNHNVNLFVMRAQDGLKKVWIKINIYVNNKIVKSVEDKFMDVGPTIQFNLNEAQ